MSTDPFCCGRMSGIRGLAHRGSTPEPDLDATTVILGVIVIVIIIALLT